MYEKECTVKSNFNCKDFDEKARVGDIEPLSEKSAHHERACNQIITPPFLPSPNPGVQVLQLDIVDGFKHS